MVSWDDLLKIFGAITVLAAAAALLVATYRAKSDDSWRKTAERRKADYDDLAARLAETKETLKDAERERDQFTQRYLRAQAKVEWYENRYGIIPTDVHSSRG